MTVYLHEIWWSSYWQLRLDLSLTHTKLKTKTATLTCLFIQENVEKLLFQAVCFLVYPLFDCLVGDQFAFSPLCVLKCCLKLLACEDAKSHWLHLFGLSPPCIFKCLLKLPASEDAKPHWLHLFDFSPLWVFKCVFKSPAR